MHFRKFAELWNFAKQRNKCAKVLRKAKQQYFNNNNTLNSKRITDTKEFWKIVKPLFSNKSKTTNKIILDENNRIIKDNKKISHILNKYFTDLTKNLKLK